MLLNYETLLKKILGKYGKRFSIKTFLLNNANVTLKKSGSICKQTG